MQSFKYLLIALVFSVGCQSQLDNEIKKGYFNECENYTVEKLLNKAFENGEWESFVSPDDDKYHLNFEGEIQIKGKKIKHIIQFQFIDEEEGDWEINAWEVDGEPQTNSAISAMIDGICVMVGEGLTWKEVLKVAKDELKSANITYRCPVCKTPEVQYCFDCESTNVIWCKMNGMIKGLECLDCGWIDQNPSDYSCSKCEVDYRPQSRFWKSKNNINHKSCQ
jgi:hypothetical protein